MTSCLSLAQIFQPDYDFAWRLLDAQCSIHISKDITIDDVAKISEMYMKAIQKLNAIQDQREKYFSQKMQKLMARPYVIRCFNNKCEGKKNQLDYKRKAIQQKLSQENQKSHPERLQQMINQYGQKQKKVKQKIEKIMVDHQKNLQQRLKKRAHKPNKLSDSSSLQSPGRKGYCSHIEPQNLSTTYFNPQNSIRTKSSQTEVIQIHSP